MAWNVYNQPEIISRDSRLVMFCTEQRMQREIFWSGFGFQIWCQLLTHIYRSKNYSLTVIDEPEVYLHPDIQRQLVNVLRNYTNEYLLATHSVEIIGESEPSEILLIDKTKKSAKKVKNIEGVQQVLDAIGSIQNISLTQLARNKRVLFIEGSGDYKAIRKFSAKLGFNELSAGTDITPIESGGFSSWEKIKALAWGLKDTLGTEIKIAAIYDRDYWCDEQVLEVLNGLKEHLAFAHIHNKKEIENYFLNPTVLERLIQKLVADKKINNEIEKISASQLLENISDNFKTEFQSQYIAKYTEYNRISGKDPATLASEAITVFENKWKTLETRMDIVGGKTIIRALRTMADEKWGISLTDTRIINEFRKQEIPRDLVHLIETLEAYRNS